MDSSIGPEPPAVVSASPNGELKTQVAVHGAYRPWRREWGLPARWVAIVDAGDPYLGRLSMSFDEGAAPRCDEWEPLQRDGTAWPASSSARALPPLWKVAAIDAAAVRALPTPEGQTGYAVLGDDPDRSSSLQLASANRQAIGQPLRLVARLYREDGPTTVSRELSVSQPQAHRLIAECRQQGLLVPTPRYAPPGDADAAARVIYSKLELRPGEDYWVVPAGPRAGTKIPRRFIDPDLKPGARLGRHLRRD